MIFYLIIAAIVIFFGVVLNDASVKFGVPVLLAFILLGVIFGNISPTTVTFNDFKQAEDVCTVALIFIMFYGGFGTKWNSSKHVAVESAMLATVGVVATAVFTAVIYHLIFRAPWIDSFLLGSVIASTDAASVFSILRSRNLGLKNSTVPLLEIESGSNDPCSYMLTIVMLSVLKGEASMGQVSWMLFAQLAFGAGLGYGLGKLAIYAMKRITFATSGFDSMFLIGVALLSYALPSTIGGNGYLSCYIVGIMLGNSEFLNKKQLVHFFDGFTGLMQLYIFFMLGVLARPESLFSNLVPAVVIFLILLLLARPLAVALVLIPFRKYGFVQQLLISFSGLRGASSIVFAIVATVGATYFNTDLFSIVFCVVLLSIGLQGTLLPYVAKKLNMLDDDANSLKTFSDFSDEVNLQFTNIIMKKDGPWVGKFVRELGIPKDFLLCTLQRENGTRLIPNGNTRIQEGDSIIVCSKEYLGAQKLKIRVITLDQDSEWDGKTVQDYPIEKAQLMLITRGDESIIPHGATVLRSNDILYINDNI